jgi:hypothetical protein
MVFERKPGVAPAGRRRSTSPHALGPTVEELVSIRLIMGHVAEAIAASRQPH